ncbi:MAG: sulfotransferase [Acidobacteria bacterium]|nr:sulfotransferase [Acidobacteriota bacterium]
MGTRWSGKPLELCPQPGKALSSQSSEVMMGVRNLGIRAARKTLDQNTLDVSHSPEEAAELSARSNTRRLPSFFIIGPPRTGTTWLHQILSGSAILPRPTKETRFFDKHFSRGLGWYLAHFPASAAACPRGEVAPTYFSSPEARERIAGLIPSARVVCIFRNPVERILSLYRLKRAYAMLPWSFERAIIHDPELMQSSNYVANLTAWQAALGEKQVLATVYDDLQRDPKAYVDRLADFIHIPRFSIPEPLTHPLNHSAEMTLPRSYYRTRGATLVADWFKARKLDGLVAAVMRSRLRSLFLGGGASFNELPQDLIAVLAEIFRPEVEALEILLKRDLSAWKIPLTSTSGSGGNGSRAIAS